MKGKFQPNALTIDQKARQIRQAGLNFKIIKEKMYDNLKQKMRDHKIDLQKASINKQFEIEDIYVKRRQSSVHIDEQKRKELAFRIKTKKQSLGINTNMDFYYIDQNEIQSVKEFMFRLDTLYASKKFEEKAGEMKKKKQKVLEVQRLLVEKQKTAQLLQCLDGIKHRLYREGYVVSDQDIKDVLLQYPFPYYDNLKLTNREADRQIVSQVIIKSQQERKMEKLQNHIDQAYSKISKPMYFEVHYKKFLQNQYKKYESELQPYLKNNGEQILEDEQEDMKSINENIRYQPNVKRMIQSASVASYQHHKSISQSSSSSKLTQQQFITEARVNDKGKVNLQKNTQQMNNQLE